MNTPHTLISYGNKIQIGAVDIDENLIPMQEFEKEESDPENQTLKTFLDSILPPIKITENGLIFYEFVSNNSAILNDVIRLNRELDNQMKIRGAKERGICTIREELYGECLDEIIRQVTIGCLQRGDLLNKVKVEMNYERTYYQKLYESLIAFSLRKVLQEKKKMLKLENKEEELNKEIKKLKQEIQQKESEIETRESEEVMKMKQIKEDHDEAMKVLKSENEQKTAIITKIMTTPRDDVFGKNLD